MALYRLIFVLVVVEWRVVSLQYICRPDLSRSDCGKNMFGSIFMRMSPLILYFQVMLIRYSVNGLAVAMTGVDRNQRATIV